MEARRRPERAGVTGLWSITWHLIRARFTSKQGGAFLFAGAILSALITSALTLTVAGGTYMFYMRWQHPRGLHAQIMAGDPQFEMMLRIYIILALVACVILAPLAARLTANATVLGGKGREQRLASLRLLGLSSGDVRHMTLIEALIQSIVGVLLGTVVYFATLPAWSNLSMEAMPIEPREMVLPWWLIILLDAVLVAISVAAAGVGVHKLRVSPLGVAHGSRVKRVSGWVGLAGVAVIIGTVVVYSATVTHVHYAQVAYVLIGLVVGLVVGFSLFMTWVFSALSGLGSHLGGASVMLASRRVQADARGVWRRVGPMAFLAFIAGWMSFFPITTNASGANAQESYFMRHSAMDIQNGVLLTLAIGLVLAATGTLMSQAADVFDRATETRSLLKMGVQPGFAARVAWLETLIPLVLSLLVGVGLGFAGGYPSYRAAADTFTRLHPTPQEPIIILAIGLVLTMLALWASNPLRRRVARLQRRRND